MAGENNTDSTLDGGIDHLDATSHKWTQGTTLVDNVHYPVVMLATLEQGIVTPITSLGGAIDIHDADIHREPINHIFYQELATYTLAAPITSQDTSIEVTDATGIVIGSRLHLTDNDTLAHDHEILRATNVVGNVVTLSRPIDNSYTVAGTDVKRVSIGMNVAGTLASPASFIVIPSPGEVWHITALDLSITDNDPMDDSLFGGLPELSNGVIIRAVDSVNSVYETFSTWTNNISLALDGFQLLYSSKAPAGFYGISGTMNVKEKYGSIVRLANTDTETVYMEVLVQDDLTGLAAFHVKVHGHIEGAH